MVKTIKEEEVKLRDQEAVIKNARIEVNSMDWGMRPLMSSYCGHREADDIYQIHEVKNRDHQCVSFSKIVPKRPTRCEECVHRRPPAVDPYVVALRGIGDVKIHHDMARAVDAEYGLEVQNGWIGKGLLHHPPGFQDMCAAYDGYALCNYFNLRGMCPRFEPERPEFARDRI